jgi:site-specific DNA recombinase
LPAVFVVWSGVAAAPTPAPRLHPSLAEVYRQRVEGLQAALQGPDSAEALEAVRGLVERVVLHPSADIQRGFEIELVGEIAAMVGLGSADKGSARRTAGDQDMFLRSVKEVAGAGFEPAAFRL